MSTKDSNNDEINQMLQCLQNCKLISLFNVPYVITILLAELSVGEFAHCHICDKPLDIINKYLYESNHTMCQELGYYWCEIACKYFCVTCVEEYREIDICNKIITPVNGQHDDTVENLCCFQLVETKKLKECANYGHGGNENFNTICICAHCILNDKNLMGKCCICRKFICVNWFEGGAFSCCDTCNKSICEECESKNNGDYLYCIECDSDFHDFNLLK